MSDLNDLPTMTAKTLDNLSALNIKSIRDLLFHLPIRYVDKTRITPIADITGAHDVQIVGQVFNAKVVFGRRRMMTATVYDHSGEINLRFFHFNQSQLRGLSDGSRIICFGEARRVGRKIEMIHPQYRLLGEDENIQLADRLEPVYASTKGLQQRRLHSLIEKAFIWADKNNTVYESALSDWPGLSIQAGNILETLRNIHRPYPDVDKQALINNQTPGQKYLIFEELLAHHLSMMQVRLLSNKKKSIPLKSTGKLTDPFLQQLPFKFTQAQSRVLTEISKDMTLSHPMMRLVQGDVGSGKTVVGLMACLIAVENNCQAAFMAPTEILAEQHFRFFSEQLMPLGIQVAWLSSSLPAKKKREMLALISSGTAAIAVGTHALFQQGVEFHNLALSITDEQHRFGVQQRLDFTRKRGDEEIHTHQLTMTATPIPRTLAMSMYAHLDYSVIDELPPGRKPITTVAMSERRREEIIERINTSCQQGAQAYWVCSLIEESESLQSQAAEDTHALLAKKMPALNIGLLHGRMKSVEKEKIMQDFIQNKIHVLVATTVIEVGVDVANATLMIIENAERFGLAQLHQLRGRVGRGDKQSSCVLLYKSPLGETAKKRLDALRHTSDGFELARIDLELRGPGEVMGTKQSGDMQMRIANLSQDMVLLPQVHQAAQWLLENHPQRVDDILHRWLGISVEYINA